MTTDEGPGVGSGAPGRPGEGADPRLDDWLPDEAEIEWFPEPDLSDPPAPGKRLRRGRGAGRPGASDGSALGADVIARRRVVGFAALIVVMGAAVAIVLGVFGGGGSGSRLTPPATTTQTAATTTQPTQTTTKPPPHKAATLTVTLPAGKLLRPGDSGAVVRRLQQALKAAGFDPGAVDGKFGPGTTRAVAAFQKAKGLPDDGIVGALTVAKLNAALAASAH